MKNTHLFIALASVVITTAMISSKPQPTVNSKMKLLWKANVGKLTHRSNFVFSGNQILMGSNGSHFNDYLLEDNNGIYILDAKSGKINRFFGGEKFGDLDVNGIALINDQIIYGNDNDEIICSDKLGKAKWRIPFSGDVEHEPVHIKLNGQDVLIFASENGEARAIDPQTGNTIWQHFHPDFNGWKNGDNRTVFKIKAHCTSANVFFNRPAVADLNRDGVNDLVFNCNYEELYAISGKDGKLLWSRKPNDNYGKLYNGRESPIVYHDSKKIGFLRYHSDTRKLFFSLMDFNGRIEKNIELKDVKGHSLSHSSQVFHLLDRMIILEGDKLKEVKYNFQGLTAKDKLYSDYTDAQVSAESVRINNEDCFAILYQYSNTHNGSTLALIGKKTGKLHFFDRLPFNAESVPVIRDLNNDGKPEILIGGYDGYLYSYSLDLAAKSLTN